MRKREDPSEEKGGSFRPFCDSNEGTLVPSQSTSLSFESTESSCNITTRVTDLTGLRRLLKLQTPLQETGDAKSRIRQIRSLSSSGVQTEDVIHNRVRRDHGYVPTRAECGSRRNTGDTSDLPRAWTGNRDPSDPPPDSLWSEDMMKVVMMGNQHYLREKTAASLRPILGRRTTLDETQYICEQIMSASSSISTPPFSGYSSNLCKRKRPTQAELEKFVTERTTRRCISSTSSDEAMLLKENVLASPLRLRELVILQHPLTDRIRLPYFRSKRDCNACPTQVQLPPPFPHQRSHRLAPSNVPSKQLPTQPAAIPAGAYNTRLDCEPVNRAYQQKHINTKSKVMPGDPSNRNSPSPQAWRSELSRAIPPYSGASGEDTSTPVQDTEVENDTPDSSRTVELPYLEGFLLSSNASTFPSTTTMRTDDLFSTIAEPRVGGTSSPCSRVVSANSSHSRHESTRMLEGPCFESLYNSILQPQHFVEPAIALRESEVRAIPMVVHAKLHPYAEKLHLVPQAASDESKGKTALSSRPTSPQFKRRATQSEKRAPFEEVKPLNPRTDVDVRGKGVPRPMKRSRRLQSFSPTTRRMASCHGSSPAVLFREPFSLIPREAYGKPEAKRAKNGEAKSENKQTSEESHLPPPSRGSNSSGGQAEENDEMSPFYSCADSESEASFLPDSTKLDLTTDDEDFL